MNFSKVFIDRPIATALIMGAILLAGGTAFPKLSLAPLPNMDVPSISVSAALPGANAETMASSVASPLERQFAQMPGLTQMTSSSTLGITSISLQFDLHRSIEGVAQDVQSAISAAAGQLPKNLPNPPSYKKVNPADFNVLAFGAWSDVLPVDQVHDFVDTRIAQRLSQIPGVGQILIVGNQAPAIRIRIDPDAITSKNLSLEDVRSAIAQSSLNAPKGSFQSDHLSSTIDANDQLLKADDYRKVVVAYRNGAPVQISDIGSAVDAVEDMRVANWTQGHRGVVFGVFRQPGVNVIDTAERVKAELPRLLATMPPSIHFEFIADRTPVIELSVAAVEETLVISIILVVMVIFLFLRKLWATVIPAIAVPLSLVGTFGVMYLLNYSLDTLSLMALTIAVGFVVDDAVVMIENIVRYVEQGESPLRAAVKGASEIGFTIISITASLIAVFIPLLLMDGVVGLIFREFAVTVAIAVLISAFVSLTLTPMMCARFLGHEAEHKGRFYLAAEGAFEWMVQHYARGIRAVLRHQGLTLASLIATIALTGVMFAIIPKGFFPNQDNGFMAGAIEGPQDVSFADMVRKTKEATDIIRSDPAMATINSGVAGGAGNGGIMLPNLKPRSERDVTGEQVVARLRTQLAKIPNYAVYLQMRQDITIGARLGSAQYQYTLQGQDIDELNYWAKVMYDRMKTIPQVVDLASDQKSAAPRTTVKIDRVTASRLGVTPQQIDDTLYDAFGQRQIGTIFTQLSQYHVILELDPKFQFDAQALDKIYVKSSAGKLVPLSAFTKIEKSTWALTINHQGQYPSITLSFNLPPGVPLGDAVAIIEKSASDARMPITIVSSFQGTAQAFQSSLATMPYLIMAAIITVYIVLGILYESFIHPLTILSTVPSAGVGALLTLWLFNYPLDMLGLIAIILLIGIVKKNAIMMIDFALTAERQQGMSPEDAIYHAALLRFRPIMMTTMSAMFSGIPLMLAGGTGSEFRRPLGFAIVGGLMLSQALTLFTTPVVYLYLDRLSRWARGMGKKDDSVPVRARPIAFPAAE